MVGGGEFWVRGPTGSWRNGAEQEAGLGLGGV